MNKYQVTVYLDAGHDLSKVQLVVNARDSWTAKSVFLKAMEQLGFKRWEYGHITVSPTMIG